MAQNYAYLIQVNAAANNNKFYEITEADDGTVSVNYGRVGGKTMHKDYGYQKRFWSLKQEKENKCYEDRTALHSDASKNEGLKEELSYQPVEDETVQELLETLITSSRDFMQRNYTVKAAEITPKMISEAEADLQQLSKIAEQPDSAISLYYFNDKLQELFTDIPRSMGKVADYLAQTEDDFQKIIERETQMLNNVKGAVVQTKVIDNGDKSQTVLEAYGLQVRPVTYKEEDQIVSHLGHDYDHRHLENRYVQAFAVENEDTRKAYEQYKQDRHMSSRDVRLFYHGSKVENFYSIIKTGLSLNPNASTTGKMFGQGLYFAPECRKSLNYMDVQGSHWNSGTRQTGYCAVYAVALGKCYQPDYVLGHTFKGSDLPHGTNSVFASKKNKHLHLQNDEYIVYDQSACTIKYLLEMSSQMVRTKEYNLDRDVLRNNLEQGFDTLEKANTHGLKAELAIERLSPAVQAELSQKITNILDYDRIYMNYNEKSDKIFLVGTKGNNEPVPFQADLTSDDYGFLTREMKKAFAESENEWKSIVKASADYPIGKTVANKDGLIKEDAVKDKSKEIEETR